MAGRLADIIGRVSAVGAQPRAVSAGVGAALGAMMGPAAAAVTGDPKSDKSTMLRDMLAGAIGGAVGGLVAPNSGFAGGAGGGIAGGLFAGLFDKKASQAGQDLRSPMMGGTKFPTHDSLGSANKKLQQSSAEVGPQPSPTYSMSGQQMKKAAIGDHMDPMMDDPLVQYLKKEAAKDTAKEVPPLSDLVSGSQLKDNLDNMPLGKDVQELTSMPPQPTKRMYDEGKSEVNSSAQALFDNEHTMRRKSLEKDHPFEGFDQGVVDRVLGL